MKSNPPPNESEARGDAPAALERILRSARRVQVIAGGSSNGAPFGKEVLAVTSDAKQLEELRQALQFLDEGRGHCMCHGDPTLVLSDSQGDVVAVLGLHHGIGVRWNGWDSDARLVDGERLLRWLEALSVSYPLQEFRAAQAQARESATTAERWRAAVPRPLADFPIFDPRMELDASSLVPDLEKAFPDPGERASALFDWLGHGAGPWSGFPSYEMLPIQLLMSIPIDALLSAVRREDATGVQVEGAARFLGSWDFRRTRQADLAHLSALDRKRLLDAALRSSEPDNHTRARKAFETKT